MKLCNRQEERICTRNVRPIKLALICLLNIQDNVQLYSLHFTRTSKMTGNKDQGVN